MDNSLPNDAWYDAWYKDAMCGQIVDGIWALAGQLVGGDTGLDFETEREVSRICGLVCKVCEVDPEDMA